MNKRSNIKLNVSGVLFGMAAVLVSVAVLLIVIYVNKSKNKSKTTTKLPQDTDWGKELTDVEGNTIARIAQALYNDMKGLNWSHDEKIYNELNQQSDKMLVAIANQFATINGNGESLTQWMRDELWSWSSFTLSGTCSTIIKRLEALGVN